MVRWKVESQDNYPEASGQGRCLEYGMQPKPKVDFDKLEGESQIIEVVLCCSHIHCGSKKLILCLVYFSYTYNNNKIINK